MTQFFLYAGIVCIIISGMAIGAWVHGDRQRANFFSETKEHRNTKTRVAMYSGLAGIICLGISGLIWYL
ncbi:DUF5316 family protein [Bacillus sp. FJAT-42376]|uniref:DUF5316 family protein n=1 Tax=Bacillus sp. FJAT-42376 TaxID=2014076 RepID=UPI000F4E1DD9|nr:DUF5316 family protein [Bacillus sp. FJAT-42376]